MQPKRQTELILAVVSALAVTDTQLRPVRPAIVLSFGRFEHAASSVQPTCAAWRPFIACCSAALAMASAAMATARRSESVSARRPTKADAGAVRADEKRADEKPGD